MKLIHPFSNRVAEDRIPKLLTKQHKMNYVLDVIKKLGRSSCIVAAWVSPVLIATQTCTTNNVPKKIKLSTNIITGIKINVSVSSVKDVNNP